MPKLTKTGEVLTNDWQVQAKDAALTPAQVAEGKWLLHAKWYLENKDSVSLNANLGLWLDSDEEAASIGEVATQVAVIGVNFPVFTDGRGFSIGRTLRERYGFSGELRALGNFMQDQLFYLKRCGFDAFMVSDTANTESMAKSLRDFTDYYQAAVDQPLPLFRRRMAQ